MWLGPPSPYIPAFGSLQALTLKLLVGTALIEREFDAHL